MTEQNEGKDSLLALAILLYLGYSDFRVDRTFTEL